MLNFFVGAFIGIVVGFLGCAVLSVNNSEKYTDEPLKDEETGDSNDR